MRLVYYQRVPQSSELYSLQKMNKRSFVLSGIVLASTAMFLFVSNSEATIDYTLNAAGGGISSIPPVPLPSDLPPQNFLEFSSSIIDTIDLLNSVEEGAYWQATKQADR